MAGKLFNAQKNACCIQLCIIVAGKAIFFLHPPNGALYKVFSVWRSEWRTGIALQGIKK